MKKQKHPKKIIKKWMIVHKTKECLILHLNEELPQYKKLKRVSDKLIRSLLK